jgi:hypothetical protein
MDPDPAIFVIDLKTLTKNNFLCFLHFEGTFTSFFKAKKSYRSNKKQYESRGFSYYFCMMIEGSGSGSIPLTNESGSGSRKSKNIRILFGSGSGSATLFAG